MTQDYIGCKRVTAFSQEKDGKPGYGVIYPDGYQSWSPKDVFECAYIGIGEGSETTVTQEMVDDFILTECVETIGEKTTVVVATLVNGFEIVASSSCVSPENYSEKLGAEICRKRINDKVWELLGFALQWAVNGVRNDV